MNNNLPIYLLKETEYTIRLDVFYNTLNDKRLKEVEQLESYSKIEKIKAEMNRQKYLIQSIRDNQLKESYIMGKTNTKYKNIYLNLNCHRVKHDTEKMFIKELCYTINHEIFHIILKAEQDNRTSNQLHNILHILKPYGVY